MKVSYMIRAVIFDFGQTLADSADGFRMAEKDAQQKIFKDLSITLRDVFMSNYRRIRKEFHSRSNFSRLAMWREVYYYYCRTSQDDLLETWETEYWATVRNHTRLFPETETVLDALRKRCRVALITNTQGQKAEGTHRIAQYPQLEKYFEVIVVAGEGGIPPKPDPLPFRICLEKMKIDPSAAVYVGDDWRIDVCGSQAAGLRPVWLKHHSVRRNWPEAKTTLPVITSLNQLLELEDILN